MTNSMLRVDAPAPLPAMLAAARDRGPAASPSTTGADVTVAGAGVSILPSPATPIGRPSTGMQPVEPNLLWNWQRGATRRTDRKQLQFCRSRPQTCAAGAAFVPTGDFEQNYAAFLEALADAFFPRLVAEARAAIDPPAHTPAGGPTPNGWTTFMDTSGLLRWSLGWAVSMMPGDVPANIGPPVSLTASAYGASVSLDGVAANCNASSIELEASWLSVTVTPAPWYKSGLVALARHLPAKAFSDGTGEVFFGSDGMLACRVAEFVVADRPTARIGLEQPVTGSDMVKLAGATEARVAGLHFSNPEGGLATVEDGGSTLKIAMPTESTPRIVGVVPSRP